LPSHQQAGNDKPKRELFAKLADDLTAMALDVERQECDLGGKWKTTAARQELRPTLGTSYASWDCLKG